MSHSLYRLPNIVRTIKSRRLRWAGHVARMEEGRSAFKIVTGTPAGKRPLGRPRRRLEDNIRMDFKEIGINTRNWVDSAEDVNAALNLRVQTIFRRLHFKLLSFVIKKIITYSIYCKCIEFW